LQKGTNEVIVKALPHAIDSESVRVDGRGKATICEVQYQEKYVKATEAHEADEKRKALQKHLDDLRDKKQMVIIQTKHYFHNHFSVGRQIGSYASSG
jgi:hypothetical protein